MNIGLIYSLDEVTGDQSLLPSALSIHFGLSFIAKVLMEAGHTVKIIVLTPNTNIIETVSDFISDFHPKMIGFTSVATQYPIVLSDFYG